MSAIPCGCFRPSVVSPTFYCNKHNPKMNTKQSPTRGTISKDHEGCFCECHFPPFIERERIPCDECVNKSKQEKSELEPASNTEELVKEIAQDILDRFTERDEYGTINLYSKVELFDLNQVLLQELTTVIETTRKETEKAFGGCTKCYGKGYSTERQVWTDHGSDREEVKVVINYCSCDRGKQLDKYLTEGEDGK